MPSPRRADRAGAQTGTAGQWMARAARRLGRRAVRTLRISLWSIGRGIGEFYHSENMAYAGAIAYYALLGIFPFSILVLAVMDRITVGGNEATLLQLVTQVMPAKVDFLAQIKDLGPRALQLGVVGTVVMLWASMGVFSTLTSAVNHAWGVETPPGFFRHKLIAFVMLLVAGLLMVLAILLVSAAQVADTTWFTDLVARWPLAGVLRGFVVRNATTTLFVLVVGLIYYYAPNAKVRLRDVWVGALTAGVLWRVAFALLSWYLSDLSRFSMEGSVTTVIVFLVWVYASAVIFLYGAEVSAAYARTRKQLPHNLPAAAVRDVVS